MINIDDMSDINETKVQEELSNLEQLITIQMKNRDNLLTCLNKINKLIEKTNNEETKNASIEILKNINFCIENLKQNISNIKDLKEILAKCLDSTDVSSNIKKYNNLFIIYYSSICQNDLQITNCMSDYIKHSDLTSLTLDMSNQSNCEDNTSLITDNNVLLISEKQNKVYLPYKISELQEKLKNNENYNTIQEIINKEYVIPLTNYKNPIASRFRESYNLMKNKEKASTFDSFNLALELAFNFLLNPAIITACKNLDELDVYLDCLNCNELNKFNFFEIKYEIMPKKI